MSAPAPGLCESCRELKPDIAWTDTLGREYCTDCFSIMPVATAPRMLAFLALTIPFHVGDRVECRTAGALYDGVGVVEEISTDPATFGTPVYPAFHVRIQDKAYEEAPDDRWYMETQLKKVGSE